MGPGPVAFSCPSQALFPCPNFLWGMVASRLEEGEALEGVAEWRGGWLVDVGCWMLCLSSSLFVLILVMRVLLLSEWSPYSAML